MFLPSLGNIVEVFDIDERPREVVSFTDGLEPSAFVRKTGCAVEVAYGWLNAGSSYTLLIVSRGGVLPCMNTARCSIIADV